MFSLDRSCGGPDKGKLCGHLGDSEAPATWPRTGDGVSRDVVRQGA